MAKISVTDTEFEIKVHHWENQRVKQMPERKWDRKRGAWFAPFTETNAEYIRREFSIDETSPSASLKVIELLSAKLARLENKEPFPAWYEFNKPPRKHQRKALDKAWSVTEFALFHSMRTGKTFTAVNLACARGQSGQINALLVICPTPIKSVWELQTKEHAPIATNVFILEAGAKQKKVDSFIADTSDSGLKVLVVGIEALSQGGATGIAERFVLSHKCMAVVDESSRIKNHDKARTEKAIAIGSLAKYRLILTGTSITQGIQDLYAQMKFLGWKIIGHKSYFTFRNRYCIMGGFDARQIVGYLNVKELMELVAPYCDVVSMEDVVDLPPNIYQKRYISPSPAQKKAFNELRDLFYTEHEDGEVLETKTVLDRMTRYQQIAGGSFPFKTEDGYDAKPIPGKNPKMEELKLLLDEIQGKVIIWARFRPEILLISEFLQKIYGSESVNLIKFQETDGVRFFVSNQQTGGMGIELSAAQTSIYFSNSFSLEERIQSEARPHHVDMKDSCLYIDLILDHKVDKMIHVALEKKQEIASFVNAELKGAGE